jgi:hypothetical protein
MFSVQCGFTVTAFSFEGSEQIKHGVELEGMTGRYSL